MGEKLYLEYSRRSFKCKRCIEEEVSHMVKNKKARKIFVDYYNSPIELFSIEKTVGEFVRKFERLSQNEKERIFKEGKKLIEDKKRGTLAGRENNGPRMNSKEPPLTEKEFYTLDLLLIKCYLHANAFNRIYHVL